MIDPVECILGSSLSTPRRCLKKFPNLVVYIAEDHPGSVAGGFNLVLES